VQRRSQLSSWPILQHPTCKACWIPIGSRCRQNWSIRLLLVWNSQLTIFSYIKTKEVRTQYLLRNNSKQFQTNHITINSKWRISELDQQKSKKYTCLNFQTYLDNDNLFKQFPRLSQEHPNITKPKLSAGWVSLKTLWMTFRVALAVGMRNARQRRN